MSHWESGENQLAWERLRDPLEEVEEVAGAREVCYPHDLVTDQQKKMDLFFTLFTVLFVNQSTYCQLCQRHSSIEICNVLVCPNLLQFFYMSAEWAGQ